VTPKTIHLCWFSDDAFPVEIKACIRSWKKFLPDYQIRRWNMEDAKAIHNTFVNEALRCHKWAFAADVIRFYAIYHEGGIYMDSDMLIYKNFDELIPEKGVVTFNENIKAGDGPLSLQAAFIMGEKGNTFCKEVLDYYSNRHFLLKNGSMDETISPHIMGLIAAGHGYKDMMKKQELDGLTIFPTFYVAPRKKYKKQELTFARHLVNHSWKTHKLGRQVEIFLKHDYHVVKYFICKKY
jgi:hypothetical protein